MEKYNRIEHEWINSLQSPNHSSVISTIQEIRNSGTLTILPVLFSMINKNTDILIRTEILNLLSELKAQASVPLIVESIGKNDYEEFLPSFIAACWMSGLDFSGHLQMFIKLFVQADYLSALEAFTVIEESIHNASDDEILVCKRYLKDNECMVADEKFLLYQELRKLMEKK